MDLPKKWTGRKPSTLLEAMRLLRGDPRAARLAAARADHLARTGRNPTVRQLLRAVGAEDKV